MCKDCFITEIESFLTENEYWNFDLTLTKKIANEKTIKHITFVKTAEVKIDNKDYEDIGYNVYKCTVCGQLWRHQLRNFSDLGYFIRVSETIVENDLKAVMKKKE